MRRNGKKLASTKAKSASHHSARRSAALAMVQA
jgi:hypothetical protein